MKSHKSIFNSLIRLISLSVILLNYKNMLDYTFAVVSLTISLNPCFCGGTRSGAPQSKMEDLPTK